MPDTIGQPSDRNNSPHPLPPKVASQTRAKLPAQLVLSHKQSNFTVPCTTVCCSTATESLCILFVWERNSASGPISTILTGLRLCSGCRHHGSHSQSEGFHGKYSAQQSVFWNIGSISAKYVIYLFEMGS